MGDASPEGVSAARAGARPEDRQVGEAHDRRRALNRHDHLHAHAHASRQPQADRIQHMNPRIHNCANLTGGGGF